ncbi:hypothetical protein DFH09DRAFT_1458006 [Mycena vulgaris]|nr:hypothetical protein DFH09DRAFT_1458006 [Mycena vulgaris]
MPFSQFDSVPSQEPRLDRDSCGTCVRDDDSADTLLHSAINLLEKSRKGPKKIEAHFIRDSSSAVPDFTFSLGLPPYHSPWNLGKGPRTSSHFSHRRPENHQFSNHLDHTNFRNRAHFDSIRILRTKFMNRTQIYSALLVFVTQTISTRRSLQKDQTLTAAHDTAAAWAGVGSALLHMWCQKTVNASIIGVLSAFLYLGNILVLHISTPALFYLEAYNFTQLVPVPTRGLPSYNFTWYNVSDEGQRYGNLIDFQQDYAAGSLYFLPTTFGNATSLGLKDGTLYDVPEPNSGIGNVTVSPTGFNITCGYPTDVDVDITYSEPYWTVTTDGERGIISGLVINGYIYTYDVQHIFLYSTIPIVDSNKAHPQANLTDVSWPVIPSIQLFRCSQSLVSQMAIFDAQSRQIEEALGGLLNPRPLRRKNRIETGINESVISVHSGSGHTPVTL